jgi:hypothetical protein
MEMRGMIFVLAQAPTTDIGPEAFTSVAGIILITTAAIEAVRRTLSDKSFFGKIPMFIYVTLCSVILTLIANKVFHTLSGNLKDLIFHTVSGAMASSGFYNWIRHGLQGVESTHPNPNQPPTTTVTAITPSAPTTIHPTPTVPTSVPPTTTSPTPTLPQLPSPTQATIAEFTPQPPPSTEFIYLRISSNQPPKPTRKRVKKVKSRTSDPSSQNP